VKMMTWDEAEELFRQVPGWEDFELTGRPLHEIPPAQPHSPSLYFLQEGDRGPIKIGVTSSISARIALLQTANPHRLRLLGVCEGSIEKEAALHQQFKHLRIRGEWFKPGKDLVTFIRDLPR
jgi:Meiotically up-regulated gene 113